MCLINECLYLDLGEEEGVTCNVTFIGHLRTLITNKENSYTFVLSALFKTVMTAFEAQEVLSSN